MDNTLSSDKTNLIDYIYRHYSISSFADLGGVWGVGGGYTFYALENYLFKKAYLVDTDILDSIRERQKSFPQLSVVEDNFGSYQVTEKIGKVDVLFMFDILLHQVAPDWNEILEMYSKIAEYIIIVNPQHIRGKTVRLIDSGIDEYFKNVPHNRDEEPYKSFIEKMYEIHPQHNRIYKNIHNVWQWGIINNDLIDTMKKFGFENVYHRNYGQWGSLKNFENNAFIFKKIQ